MRTRRPLAASESIELKGLSDRQVIQITNEMLKESGVNTKNITPIKSRNDALTALFAICQIARNNPALSVIQALGEIPTP